MSHTIKGGTMTTEGFIPYMPYRGLMLPVALQVRNTGMSAVSAPQAPARRSVDGALYFVLPGGSVVTA